MKPSINLRSSARYLTVRVQYLTYAVATAIAAYSGSTLAQTVAFPSVPLTVATAVPANLLYIHDDSNSMYWSYMPDNISRFRAGLSNASLAAVPYQFYMSPQFNKMYYNPAVRYVPPPAPPGVTPTDADGKPVTDGTLGNAKFTNAWFNGYDLISRNQSGFYATDVSVGMASVQTTSNTTYRRFNLATDFTPTDDYSLNLGLFYGPISGSRGLVSYVTEFLPGAPTARASYYICQPTAWKDYPKVTTNAADYTLSQCQQYFLNTDEEKQNFANWYSYYRSRNYASKAGIGRAFEKLDPSVRVGWGLINKKSSVSMDGKSVDTVMQGVRKFDQARKGEFLDWLYKIQVVNMNNPPLVSHLASQQNDAGATPLRRALDSAGRYYDRSDGSSLGPWADDPAKPGTVATEKAAACRKSFTILMTDGYWNSSEAATTGIRNVNVDGNAPYPFRDSYSNTLADIAWFYWNKKLLPNSVANKVPKTLEPGTLGVIPPKYRDGAEHQHMTTFTIGLGVSGNEKITKEAVFGAMHNPSGTEIIWGNPTPDANAKEKIDDLLHTALNGHGDFFSASNPDEFVDGMSAIINSVNSAQKASSGNIDASSSQGTSVSTDVYIYKTHFKPDDWRGELIAQKIDAKTGLLEEVWLASEQMPSPAMRRMYTRSGSNGVPFVWANLDGTLRNALSGPGQLLDGQKVLDYVRGGSTNEGSDPGQFRPRYRGGAGHAPLADSPHNSPLFVKYGSTSRTIFLGANDGMLHAFNADDGTEQFAYIPSALISKLSELTIGHSFYVDGEILVTNPGQTPDKYYLVGALGRGGKGLYGLDVSNPAAFSGSDVKWEINAPQTCSGSGSAHYLGNIVGSLTYVDVNGKPSAVFGNGYNSCNDQAALGIVDIIDGSATFIRASDELGNGLAAPAIFGTASAYAGDLRGKMWKFSLAPSVGAAQRFFDAGTADQPITARPVANTLNTGPDAKKTFVYFGTGRYFSISDRSTTAQQNMYGLIDENNAATILPGDLWRHSFSNTGSVGGVSVKSVAGSANMNNRKGWTIPLVEKGERVVSAPIIAQTPRGDVAIFTSIIPPVDGDPCDPRGSGWLYAVNAQTGNALDFIFFDLNGDGKFDANDTDNGKIPSAIKIGDLLGGMPGQAEMVNGRLVVCGLDSAECVSIATQNSASGTARRGRVSWREIIH